MLVVYAEVLFFQDPVKHNKKNSRTIYSPAQNHKFARILSYLLRHVMETGSE
jgi:hypothetical protein